MCGIVGWVGHEPSPDLKARLRRAHDDQRHRGPDGGGWLEYTPAAAVVSVEREPGARREFLVAKRPARAQVIIGHRRLAIIERSAAGGQPMGTPDAAAWIAFNGEVYNYRELRDELVGRGRTFRSGSDTEVLLQAFLEWRGEVFGRLVGMFAFAALDTVAGTLILARDHFGQKPLYYRRQPASVTFASEMRTLLTVGATRPVARPSVIFDLLVRGATDHRPETMFDGIEAVPPGHWMQLDLERPADAEVIPYWALQPQPARRVPFAAAVTEIRGRFLESVDVHMRSDVPVGTLLSGGVDSSSVVMGMRHVGREAMQLHTFSYVGQGSARSEEPWIDSVNTAARAVPHKLRLDPTDWSRRIDAVTSAHDEPIGSLAIYAQHMLFRMAADAGVKVLLDGQGGDELMAGYRGTWSLRVAGLLRAGHVFEAIRFLRRMGAARGAYDPSPSRVLRAALRATLRVPAPVPVPSWVDTDWFRERGVERVHPILDRMPRTVHEALVHSTQVGLPALLRWADRSGMASSIEGRLPFLVPRLAEAFLTLPDPHLIGPDGTNKYVFRSAMRGLVPDDVLGRYEKIGFSVPHRDWLQQVPDLERRLEVLRDLPCFRRPIGAMVHLVRRNPRAIGRRETLEIWRLIGFANWARVFNIALP